MVYPVLKINQDDYEIEFVDTEMENKYKQVHDEGFAERRRQGWRRLFSD